MIKRMHTLVFVDDHPLYREGLSRALKDAMPDLQVLTADSCSAALALLARMPQADLCLSDFQLPDGDGLHLLSQVGAAHPTVARGLLCGGPTPAMARRARDMGCVACMAKDRDIQGLSDALSRLFDGEEVFDVQPHPALAAPTLSDKRREILRLAAKGLSNKEISALMGTTERTVKDHWSNIFEQLGVSNRTEAVSVALRDLLL